MHGRARGGAGEDRRGQPVGARSHRRARLARAALPAGDAKVDVLSGGEKRRVALARLLLEGHDMLLLDEPTNHLDAQSVAWLQTYLADFQGTVVAITHDRYFLEETCKWILELERGEGKPFEGNYSGWLAKKAQLIAQQKKQDDALQKTLENELEWVRSNAKARQTKSKARLARYEELLNTPAREALAHSATIYVPPGPRLGSKVIEASALRKGFGERVLIDDLSFTLPPGGIVGVVGPNGAGKTTLIKMLKGEEAPDAGSLSLGESVKLISIEQTREGLDDDNSVFEEVTGGGRRARARHGDRREPRLRQLVRLQGRRPAEARRRRSRAASATACSWPSCCAPGGNVMLMDEPTNDLDVDTMRSLEEALLDFAGCVVVVTRARPLLPRPGRGGRARNFLAACGRWAPLMRCESNGRWAHLGRCVQAQVTLR